MDIIIEHVKGALTSAFEKGKVNSHNFFSYMNYDLKEAIGNDLMDLLYYAVCLVSEIEENKNITHWYFDYLNDLNKQPQGFGKARTAHWNLWKILKLIKNKLI